MIAKILMCSSYKEEFHARAYQYIRKKIHFRCKCQDRHIHYALFYKDHSFGAKMVGLETEKCLCKYSLSHEVCSFCLSVRYLLNSKCFKICIEKVSDDFIKEVVPFSCYLRQISCDPLFFLQ